MENQEMSDKVIIYTDGACSGNPGNGGWGALLISGEKRREIYGGEKDTTNNQMELAAIIIALRLIKKEYDSITIYSDSMYCIGCATKGWKRKKNIKLWEEFDKQFERASKLCSNIKFEHVKGHADNEWNNYVDKLAVKASQQFG